ncbi:MAG: hypothetical protein LUD51_07080 [Clostridia bacterium]|nr:hypothetical protein [Clostridia bacterium]
MSRFELFTDSELEKIRRSLAMEHSEYDLYGWDFDDWRDDEASMLAREITEVLDEREKRRNNGRYVEKDNGAQEV